MIHPSHDQSNQELLRYYIERIARRLAELEVNVEADVDTRWALVKLGEAAGVSCSLGRVRRGLKIWAGEARRASEERLRIKEEEEREE